MEHKEIMKGINEEGVNQACGLATNSKGKLLGIAGVALTAIAGVGAYFFCKNRRNNKIEETECIDEDSEDVSNELNDEE